MPPPPPIFRLMPTPPVFSPPRCRHVLSVFRRFHFQLAFSFAAASCC